MLLKRKTYLVALGVIAAQACLARYVGDGTRTQILRNCPTCQAAASVPLPISMSSANFVSQINAQLSQGNTGFTAAQSNNTILNAVPNTSAIPATMAANSAVLNMTQNYMTQQTANQAATLAANQAAAVAVSRGANAATAQALAQAAALSASQSVYQSASQYNALMGSYLPAVVPAYQWTPAPAAVGGPFFY